MLRAISQEHYSIWLFLVPLCKMMISPGLFFHFLKILIFWVVSVEQGQKMAQNDKKLHLLRFISQEPYIKWLSFMVHLCEMMISPGFFFFIFWKFWFFRLLVGNKVKKWPKMTKNYISCTLYLRNHTSYDCHLWYTCVKWWYLQAFFSFLQNFDFLGF